MCARFFLGESQAIGLLAAGDQVLFWHTFELPSGGEIGAVLAAYSTLWMMGRHARITLPIDTVIIHGRPDLVLSEQQEEAFGPRTGAKLFRADQPAYDLGATALGLSLANPVADNTGLNLARTLKPPVTIKDIFPYGELLAHTALMVAVSLFLVGMATESNHRLAAVSGALKSFPWLKNQDQPKLDAEKKAVQDKLKAISVFRDTRIKWSGASEHRRRHARKYPDYRAGRRLRDRGRLWYGPRKVQEKARCHLRDAAGRKRIVTPGNRRIPGGTEGRRDTETAFPVDRGHRLSSKPGQAKRASLGNL